MASALLASRNEPHWGERKVYMRKIPNSNPNPNPRDSHAASGGLAGQFHPPEPVDLQASTIGGAAASDDSSSYRRSGGLRHRRDSSSAGYVTFNISAYSRRELRDLKRRLASELEQVRTVASRIESRELQSSARSAGFSASGVYPGAGREVNSNHLAPPLDALTPRSDALGEKRTFQKVSGGHKTPIPPVASPREPKRLAVAAPEVEKLRSAMMKKCGQVLAKLMKQKGCVWFNSPVDVVGMGLHDYFQIIKNPMDLGTVKSKLAKGLYMSPEDFAADIRLTFNNALRYNPAGHEVHRYADQFLRHFEGLYGPAYEKYEKQQNAFAREEERQRASSRSRLALAEGAVRPEPPAPVIPIPAPAPVPVMPPVQAKQQQPPPPPPPQPQPVLTRTLMGKQPKPKAKDLNKRPMTLEEKRKLSTGLQSLPDEKMSQVLQIVRKRNLDPAQHGDEIELDIELIDTETLWELDRFVCNCKKMMSKIKRQEALATNLISAPPSAPAPAALQSECGDKSPMSGETPEVAAAKKSKKGEIAGEEDVDIGDEMPSTNCPPLLIEKDAAAYSSSGSSSGSESSSSSDSDSDSSSGSDSDEDEAQPAAVG